MHKLVWNLLIIKRERVDGCRTLKATVVIWGPFFKVRNCLMSEQPRHSESLPCLLLTALFNRTFNYGPGPIRLLPQTFGYYQHRLNKLRVLRALPKKKKLQSTKALYNQNKVWLFTTDTRFPWHFHCKLCLINTGSWNITWGNLNIHWMTNAKTIWYQRYHPRMLREWRPTAKQKQMFQWLQLWLWHGAPI